MPTYNSEAYLGECLESFKRQSFEDWELICVDRGSDDHTLEILQGYAASWARLKIVRGGSERTSQINIAVGKSSSEYIYYTASDFVVDERLIEDAVHTCKSNEADGAWIECVSYGSGFWARVRNLERSTYFGSEKFEGVRFFRRDTYLRVGGYDDKVPIFEEYDLQDRLLRSGASLARVTTSREYHLGEPKSLLEISKKSFYYGTQYVALVEKQGTQALRHANPLRSTFFKHWRSFLAEPVLTAGFAAMLVAKYGAGALGALLGFLRRITARALPH